MVPDFFLVEEACRQQGLATVLVGILDGSDLLLQGGLLILYPVLQRAELILEDGGSCLLDFTRHTLLPLVGLVALVTALDGGLEVSHLGVERDELVEPVLESVGEDVPIVGGVLLGALFGGNLNFFFLLFLLDLLTFPGHILQ